MNPAGTASEAGESTAPSGENPEHRPSGGRWLRRLVWSQIVLLVYLELCVYWRKVPLFRECAVCYHLCLHVCNFGPLLSVATVIIALFARRCDGASRVRAVLASAAIIVGWLHIAAVADRAL